MSTVAFASDSAAMESFWSLLERDVLDQQTWATRDQLHCAITCWTSTPTSNVAGGAASASSPTSISD